MATITIAIHFAALAYFAIGFAVAMWGWRGEWRNRQATTEAPTWDANDALNLTVVTLAWPLLAWFVADGKLRKRKAKRRAETIASIETQGNTAR